MGISSDWPELPKEGGFRDQQVASTLVLQEHATLQVLRLNLISIFSASPFRVREIGLT